MTLYLSADLPAYDVLRGEGLSVADDGQAPASALHVSVMNLMPDRISTETQFSRMLARSGRDVVLNLLRPTGHKARHTPQRHMDRFYRTWPETQTHRIDGLIVTGAPVETLPFEDVNYWPEMVRLLNWAKNRQLPSLHVCWAGQAALKVYHDVPKHPVGAKLFGVFEQTVHDSGARVLDGVGSSFPVAVSRHTEVREADLPRDGSIRILASSDASGLCMLEDFSANAVYMFNHFEYDTDTLVREYRRDVDAGQPIAPPANVSIDDAEANPARDPSWRKGAVVFFDNWLSRLVEARGWPADKPTDYSMVSQVVAE